MGNFFARAARVAPIRKKYRNREAATEDWEVEVQSVCVGTPTPSTDNILEGLEFDACAETSMANKEVTLKWKLRHFRESIQAAASQGKELIAKFDHFLPFRRKLCTSKGHCGVFVAWLLLLKKEIDLTAYPEFADLPNNKMPWRVIRLELEREDPVIEREQNVCCPYCRELLQDVFTRIAVKIIADGHQIGHFRSKIVDMKVGNWGWDLFAVMKKGDEIEHVQADGSFLLTLANATFFPTEGTGTVTKVTTNTTKFRSKKKASEVKEQCKDRLLGDIGSLLLDKSTSDIIISVVEGDNNGNNNACNENGANGSSTEDGFFCHKCILTARIPALREILENGSQNGFVRHVPGSNVLEVSGISREVVGQFITFIYTGCLHEYVFEGQGDQSTWSNIVGDLLRVAEFYDMLDLKDYCDSHLYLAVTDDNVGEMYRLAKRYDLQAAEKIVFDEYQDKLEVLIDSLCKK